MKSLQKEIKSTFFQTLEDLKTKVNFQTFFSDFFTEKELELFANRLAIAYWLKKKRSNENIKTNLIATTKEINAVKNKMGTNGYKMAIKHLESEEWANKWSKIIKKVNTQISNVIK